MLITMFLIIALVSTILLDIIIVICIFLAGQSCGTYYGDCRGLPTYALVSIISSGLLLLLVCIRCCIYLSSNNTRATPRRVLISAQNPRLVRVQAHPYPNNLSTGSPTAVPVHIMREEAPPSYIVATSSTIQPPKY